MMLGDCQSFFHIQELMSPGSIKKQTTVVLALFFHSPRA